MKKNPILKSVLMAVCLTFLAASAHASLNLADGTASGQWWNPTRDGEGFFVEIIDTGGNLQIGVAMYSYNEAGEQLWLVGNVAIADGDQGATVPVFLIEGHVWGTSYDPADKSTTEFGSIVVRFPSCDTALFSVQSSVEGLESGIYPLVRATDLVGIECTNPPPSGPEEVATPGQWTGENICFFINTEPLQDFPPGTWLQESDLCNGYALEAEISGVEVDLKGETGPACQASIECSENWGINYPGDSTFGWGACSGPRATAEIYFTSATESIVVVYEDVDGAGTICVGQGGATPAQ
jgi:hypothetical protein